MERLTVPILVFFLMLVLIILSVVPITGSYSFEGFDYSRALSSSLLFFEANKCGEDVENGGYSWRSNCHESDGSDKGLRITGGYHDDGEYNKSGILQAYSASIMGWALAENDNVYVKTETKEKQLEILKRFTDYFMKCYEDKSMFAYNIYSNINTEGIYWERDKDDNSRQTIGVANDKNPASEILGLTAASLYLMSKNYSSVDTEYSDRCWNEAELLFEWAKRDKQLSKSQNNSGVKTKYETTSFLDDLAWAAACKYMARPNDEYIREAENFINEARGSGTELRNDDVLFWDNMYLPALLVVASVNGNDEFRKIVEENLKYWANNLPSTDGGLKYYNNDESLLNNAAAKTVIATMYDKYFNSPEMTIFAKSQIDYILGDNPEKFSYIIGFGLEWPKHPHHIEANGYTSTNKDYQKEAKNLLNGALISGPDKDDKFKDDVDDLKYTNVSIDYNANIAAALAGVLNYELKKEIENNQDSKIEFSLQGEVERNENGYIFVNPNESSPISVNYKVVDFDSLKEVKVIINNVEIKTFIEVQQTYNWIPTSEDEGEYTFIIKAYRENGDEIQSEEIKAIVKYE